MRIENTSSCIVSGGPVIKRRLSEKPAEARTKVLAAAPDLRPQIHAAGRTVRRFGRDYASALRDCRKRILCVAAGVAVSLAGITAISTYCTLGVNYYYKDQLLCTVAATDDAAAIIGSATRRAQHMGAPEPEISTAPKLALRSDIVNGEDAVNAILAASPGLSLARAVSLGGRTLFYAESDEVIDEALAAYVEKYRINDSAALSGEIEIKDQIVRSEELLSAEDIVTRLEQGDVLAVMNIVDLTEQQTIAHEVEEIADDSMYVGDSVTETEGSDGVVVMINEQVYRNAELLSSAVISSETTVEPVTEVVRVGTKPRNALEDGLSYPVRGTLSSGFGPRWGRTHRGIDLAVSMDTPVSAAAAGTVITAEYKESYGNLVQIDHGYGIVTSYAHLDIIGVSVGQYVERGEVVAYSGNTGNTTGPHLHFEVVNNGEYLNPLNYLI